MINGELIFKLQKNFKLRIQFNQVKLLILYVDFFYTAYFVVHTI